MTRTPTRTDRPSRREFAAEWLPRGRTLSDADWTTRHRGIVALLWAHAAALPVLSAAAGSAPLHALAHGVGIAVLAVLAGVLRGRTARAVAASVGLLTASATLVHLTGGLTEAHFHFFVVISVVTLYEDWRTFVLAFAYVVVHHGGLGMIDPEGVFRHGDSPVEAWMWAAVHGAFVLAAGVANVVAWRANEAATEQRTRHERRRADQASSQLAAFFESTDDAVVGKTTTGTITAWNPGAERLLGYDAQAIVGQSILRVVPEELWDEEAELMERVVAEARLDHYETRRVRSDGVVIDVSLTLSLVRDTEGRVLGLVGVARDISERKRLEGERRKHAEQLQVLALEDHLTGLGNFRSFHDALDREVARCARHGGGFSVVVFDLDGFKGVNDREGHAEGDRVLIMVADAMRAGGRGSDVPCRLGGDEFALLLPSTDRDGAVRVAERVRDAVRAGRDDVDISFGISVWPGDAVAKDELLAHADTALYADKALRGPGDRRSVSGEPSSETTLQRLLELACTRLDMDIAVVGEFAGAHEIVRAAAGDTEGFGMALGAAVPLEETYCQRVADGRLSGVVRDAAADDRVRDLPITAEAGIGAYVGVPVTMADGALYGFLCCMGKDARPTLDERDRKFLEVLARIAAEQLAPDRPALPIAP